MNRLLVTSNYSLLVIVLSVFLSLSSLQVYAETDLSAREIMEKVDEESRKSSESAFTRMKLTTCKYGLSGVFVIFTGINLCTLN